MWAEVPIIKPPETGGQRPRLDEGDTQHRVVEGSRTTRKRAEVNQGFLTRAVLAVTGDPPRPSLCSASC